MSAMSAQGEMTERAPAAAAPAPSGAAPAAPKQYFKGVVKQVHNMVRFEFCIYAEHYRSWMEERW